jgi:hypothetical protein
MQRHKNDIINMISEGCIHIHDLGGLQPALIGDKGGPAEPAGASWNFLTNHALVLLYISQRPEGTGLEIAQSVGITERATRRIVDDLQVAGYIERERVGRRNRYHIDPLRPIAHIGERELTVGQLLELVVRHQHFGD